MERPRSSFRKFFSTRRKNEIPKEDDLFQNKRSFSVIDRLRRFSRRKDKLNVEKINSRFEEKNGLICIEKFQRDVCPTRFKPSQSGLSIQKACARERGTDQFRASLFSKSQSVSSEHTQVFLSGYFRHFRRFRVSLLTFTLH